MEDRWNKEYSFESIVTVRPFLTLIILLTNSILIPRNKSSVIFPTMLLYSESQALIFTLANRHEKRNNSRFQSWTYASWCVPKNKTVKLASSFRKNYIKALLMKL